MNHVTLTQQSFQQPSNAALVNHSVAALIPNSRVVVFCSHENYYFLFRFPEIPCPSGYYLPAASDVCLPCNANCAECTTNATTCTKCKVLGTLNGSLCEYCTTGNFKSGASCLPCSTSDCNNCFDNASKCFDCPASKKLNNVSNNCRTCSTDTFNDGVGCTQCDPRCASCTKIGVCLSCMGNFTL